MSKYQRLGQWQVIVYENVVSTRIKEKKLNFCFSHKTEKRVKKYSAFIFCHFSFAHIDSTSGLAA